MQPKDAAIRKRTQINNANKMMFVWVAVISAVVGFALVGSIFLGQKLVFNQKVINEKQKTITILKNNNAVVPHLEDQVRVLETNDALNSIKANTTDNALQVILDALPSNANSLALGASLQSKLLSGIPGLTVNSLSVTPVLGVETTDPSVASAPAATSSAAANSTSSVSAPASASSNAIDFTFSVTGSQDNLKQALTNIERSIRAINIISLQITSQGATQQMTVQGQAYYEPAIVLGLTNKVIK